MDQKEGKENKCAEDILSIREQLKGKSGIEALKIVLSAEAKKSTSDEQKKEYLQLFHKGLEKLTTSANLTNDVLNQLDEAKLLILFDFLNYSFENISKGIKLEGPSYNATFLLKLYNAYADFRGPSGLLQGASQRKSLVTQVQTMKELIIK
ncbi:hypothetical protein pb186bvf_013209 [Paramecium bursaria]